MSFLQKVKKSRFSLKYTIKSSPQRVNKFYHHHMDEDQANQKMADVFSKEPNEQLLNIPEGKLLLYKDAIVLLTEDKSLPIKFLYLFNSVTFNKKQVVQEEHIWCEKKTRKVKIDGMPLGAYCLFKVLLPRYGMVVGADKHVPEGEKWSKRQVKEAIDKGFHVYLTNEHGVLFEATTFQEVKKGLRFFGVMKQNTEIDLLF